MKGRIAGVLLLKREVITEFNLKNTNWKICRNVAFNIHTYDRTANESS